MRLRHPLLGLAALLGLVAAPAAPAQILFRADLAGANEVPPVSTPATGLATAALDGTTLVVYGQFEDLQSDYNPNVGSHIHQGDATQNGPVQFALTPTLRDGNRDGRWFASENRFIGLTNDQVVQLGAGNFYVNVHSIDNPGGEIRAQLVPAITINELRSDQGGSDVDEYAEIAGPAGASLDGYSFVIIGDSGGGVDGVIEEIIDLSGQTIPADGYFLFGELTLATPDLEVDINFENGDSQTYLLVQGVAGAEGDDLDVGDDGVLDSEPWSAIVDAVGVEDDQDGQSYARSLGFQQFPPNNGQFPFAHIFRNRDDGLWRGGVFDIDTGFDTPGERNASTALVQIVHNAPDPAGDPVDVFVNDATAVDDFAFRTATPFVLVPASEEIKLSVGPGAADDPTMTVFDVDVTLDGTQTYYVVASGVLTPGDFPANPEGIGTAFELDVFAGAQMMSTFPDGLEAAFYHGTPDAPSVDIRTGATQDIILFDDVPYGSFGDGYVAAPAGPLEVEVTTADGATSVATFDADLTGLAGQTALLLASGFVAPPDGAPGFGVLAVLPSGVALFLEPRPVANERGPDGALALAVANPTRGDAAVRFELASEGDVRLEAFDALGRRVATLAEGAHAAGTHRATLDASRLAPGVYVLRLATGTETVTRTVTVVR